MRVLVTGGSGFVGGRLIRRLVAEGHDVLALARSETTAETVRAAGAEPLPGDLAELDDGAQAPAWWVEVTRSGLDAVVHAAAFMEFWGPEEVFVERNLVPTRALYRLAVAARVRRFVLVSAASVATGSQRAAVVDEQTDPGTPNIAYSRVKLRTERELLAAPRGETALVVLRPPYLWGPGMTATLDAFVDSARSGRFAWIDHGRHLVDFVHVDNFALAVSAALTRGPHGLVCYVTDGTPMPARNFFGRLVQTQGVGIGERSVPGAVARLAATLLEAVARARRSSTPPPLTHWIVSFMGRDRSYDITRARTVLGYEPVIDVPTGMQQLSDAHRTGAPSGW